MPTPVSPKSSAPTRATGSATARPWRGSMISSSGGRDAQCRGENGWPEAEEIRDDEHDGEQRDVGQLGAEDSGEQETQQHTGADRGPGQ